MKNFLLFFLLSSSCTYKIQNNYASRNPRIKTVAVDGIFDTTKTSLPHALFWTELQKRFALYSPLFVTSPDNADLYVRIHITDASEFQTKREVKDIVTYEPNTNIEPLDPTIIPSLNSASLVSTRQSTTITFAIEAIDIEGQEMFYSSTIKEAASYAIKGSFFPDETAPIKASESRNLALKAMAESLSIKVVNAINKKLQSS